LEIANFLCSFVGLTSGKQQLMMTIQRRFLSSPVGIPVHTPWKKEGAYKMD